MTDVPTAPSAGRTLSVLVGDRDRRAVAVGTRVGDVVPREIDGARVVAALLENRVVSLGQPLTVDCRVAPLPISHWEGERVHRRSLGLAVLEAGRSCREPMRLRLGPSIGFGQRVLLPPGVDPEHAASLLRDRMRELVAEDHPFVETFVPVEEARALFLSEGDDGTALQLGHAREPLVALASCGGARALSLGPFLPSTGWIQRFSIGAREGALYLVYRDLPEPRAPTMQIVVAGAPSKHATDMTAAHERWLGRLGIDSVGALGELCVTGGVADLIAVSEGFHEKRAADIADEIAARPGVRIITIAGPSSSGKTTFIRRLSTQLRVLGLVPHAISLDDYYRNREETPLGPDGQPDFEAFEALDLPLLHGHLAQLLDGGPVRTAHFDFETGKLQRHGGPEILLEKDDVLLLEGLHGLNAGLFAGVFAEPKVFRIFVNPSLSLPFDALSRVNASDVRLLRRIVRDRQKRATTAQGNILRWPSVRRGERAHIFPHLGLADAVFDSSLVYEPCVLKVFAERYLLEVPSSSAAYVTAYRLRHLLDSFVSIAPDHVPKNSLLREFIGTGS